MLGKAGILVIIFVLLLIFYLVIAWGAGKRGKKESDMTAEFPAPEIAGYLRGVRVLIILIAIVSLILWFLM